jgi:hypothetical protein
MTMQLTEGMTWKVVAAIKKPTEVRIFDSGLSGGLSIPEHFDAAKLHARLRSGQILEGFVFCYEGDDGVRALVHFDDAGVLMGVEDHTSMKQFDEYRTAVV